jgi:hypothetical protein
LAIPPYNWNWSGRRDSNPRPPPWQGGVLPLNYFRKMAGPLGFEPRIHGIKTRCLTAWLWPNLYPKGDRWGSNPRMPEPQSGALTTSPRPPCIFGRGSRNRTHIKGFGDLRFTIKLYPYILKSKWWRGRDSNSRTLRERIYSPPRLATSLPLRK